jgi:S-formylglutathione hydrolase FrmB
MKKNLLLLFTVFYSFSLFAQSGKVIESLEFKSNLVSYPVKYCVYLPPGYDTSERSYPVLYLLHGYSDDETGWVQFGEINRLADQGIASGDIAPCIIVMPDGKVSWYINSYDGTDPWEDMFVKEFIPFIEKEYRIRPKKEFRAVAGLSMGGFGSLVLSMRHTDLFSTCIALSAGVVTDEQVIETDDFDHYFANIFGPKPKDKVSDYWKSYNPLHLLDSVDAEKLKLVRYYIDCGDDDFLGIGNMHLHEKMIKKKIPHEFRVRDGAHSWGYWRTGLPAGMKFMSQKFHR